MHIDLWKCTMSKIDAIFKIVERVLKTRSNYVIRICHLQVPPYPICSSYVLPLFRKLYLNRKLKVIERKWIGMKRWASTNAIKRNRCPPFWDIRKNKYVQAAGMISCLLFYISYRFFWSIVCGSRYAGVLQ